jgi:hypothetical protein
LDFDGIDPSSAEFPFDLRRFWRPVVTITTVIITAVEKLLNCLRTNLDVVQFHIPRPQSNRKGWRRSLIMVFVLKFDVGRQQCGCMFGQPLRGVEACHLLSVLLENASELE